MKNLLNHLKTCLKGKCDSKLVYLARKEMWGSISRLLEENGLAALEDRGTASVPFTYDTYSGGNLLHVICAHHPPAKVVKQVAEMCPLLTTQVNTQKQTPLHVAAACGASHRAIAILLDFGSSSPAVMRDANGQTPLHLHIKHCTPSRQVCDPGYKKHEKKAEDWLVCGPDIKVLRQLAEAAPEAINMADFEGCVPSDLAEGQHPKKKRLIKRKTSALARRLSSSYEKERNCKVTHTEFVEFARRTPIMCPKRTTMDTTCSTKFDDDDLVNS